MVMQPVGIALNKMGMNTSTCTGTYFTLTHRIYLYQWGPSFV